MGPMRAAWVQCVGALEGPGIEVQSQGRGYGEQGLVSVPQRYHPSNNCVSSKAGDPGAVCTWDCQR